MYIKEKKASIPRSQILPDTWFYRATPPLSSSCAVRFPPPPFSQSATSCSPSWPRLLHATDAHFFFFFFLPAFLQEGSSLLFLALAKRGGPGGV